MSEKNKVNESAVFGEYLRRLRISKYVFSCTGFATLLGVQTSLVIKYEKGKCKNDPCIDLFWKIIKALRLNHREAHDFMLAGNRSPLRNLEQEISIRQHIECDEVWIFSEDFLYEADVIDWIISEIKSGVAYKFFTTESRSKLLEAKINSLFSEPPNSELMQFFVVQNEWCLSEHMIYLNQHKTVAIVDIFWNSWSMVFMTNDNQKILAKRKEQLQHLIFQSKPK